MALDGLVIHALSKELNTSLTGCRIDKIHQPDKYLLVLSIKTPLGNRKLLLSCNSDHPGVYFTSTNYENPTTPSALCMLFRKHLQGNRILSVSQYESERVLEISTEGLDELGEISSKKIIVELMGRYSNILLVQDCLNLTEFSEGKVLDSIKRSSLDSTTDRIILPGQPYEYPPTKDKVSYKNFLLAKTPKASFEENISNLLNKFEIPSTKNDDPSFFDDKFLFSYFQGISKAIAVQLSSEQHSLEKLAEYCTNIDSENYNPTVWLNSDMSPKDFHIVNLDIYNALSKKEFSNISEALDYYYLSRTSSNKLDQEIMGLTRNIKSQIRKTSSKKGKLANEIEIAIDSEHLRVYGELLMANLHLFKAGDKEVEVVNYYDNSKVIIPLDIKISPSKNAQSYFKRYTKARKAVEEKSKQLQKAIEELKYLDSVLAFLEMTKSPDEIALIKEEMVENQLLRTVKAKSNTKKKQKFSPYKFMTSSRKDIFVGKNNKENEHITFTVAGRKDLWFHTKDIPGSHVILKLDGEIPSEKDIIETAQIAAYFSKASTSENVPVDYTYVKYIKKLSSGKPGMVTFTDNKTIYVTPNNPEKI